MILISSHFKNISVLESGVNGEYKLKGQTGQQSLHTRRLTGQLEHTQRISTPKMRTLAFLFAFQLCCLVADGLFLPESRNTPAIRKSGPLQPKPNDRKRVIPPKYILQLYKENLKHGKSVNNLHCIFPSKF